ncbi:MAG: hypothetical protein JKY48_14800 [Flavobacteriales bacterium]|nr:hypothetical protein [Flavobacteriales bacterium]
METLGLYFSDELTGPYTEHPMSPLIQKNNRMARPAGRMIQWNGKWIRFCQDCYPNYGSNVRAFEINELTTSVYSEKEIDESPVLQMTGEENAWNGSGMHHIDPYQLEDGKWIACVDGHFTIDQKNGL